MPFYRQRQDATTNAATTVQINLLVLRPGEKVKLFAFGLNNNSGESVTIRFGIAEGTDFFQLGAYSTAGNADNAAILHEVWIFEGQSLSVRVVGTADKGPVTFYAMGQVWYGEEDEIHRAPSPPKPGA